MKYITRAIFLFWIIFGTINGHSIEVFHVIYKDSNNLEWSQFLGKFSNGCLDKTGNVDATKCTQTEEGLVALKESLAAQKCDRLSDHIYNVRLPTHLDYENLILEFDHVFNNLNGSVKLTEIGIEQIKKSFPDMSKEMFYWTSTLAEPNLGVIYSDAAYVFTAPDGSLGKYYWNRPMQFAVRCLREKILSN